MQGVGHVGKYLVEHLTKSGANVFITDINQENLKAVASEFGAKVEAFPIFTAIVKRLEEEIGSYDDSHNTDINIMPGMLLIKYN